jgi:hypothetical protein
MTIERMDNARYVTREEATKRVISLGAIAVSRLKIASREHSSPEVRRRCSIALETWYTILPSQYPFPDYPQIKFLPQNYKQLTNQAWIDHMNYLTNRATVDVGYDRGGRDLRYATKLYVRKLLDDGHPRAKVQELIDQMMFNERRNFLGDERWWQKAIPPRVAEALRQGVGPRAYWMMPSGDPPK